MSKKTSRAGGRDELNLVLLQSNELPEAMGAADAIEAAGGQVMHVFGPRVLIGRIPARAQGAVEARAGVRSMTAATVSRAPAPKTETEQLGVEAWNLRLTGGFEEAKANRPRDGDRWDAPDVVEPPDGPGLRHVGEEDVHGAPEAAAEDMSPYLIGSVAVGLILVEGPTAALQFTDAEKTKVVAEVQEGLTWLATQEPRASVTWFYDIHTVRVNVQPNPNLSGYEPLEGLWRNPALGQLGYAQNFQGVRDYVAATRTALGARWGYVAFFTKYPVHHFAYASKPRLVMHYENDGWGPDNIDRVFTHETGHIFGCPDEYSNSGCNCTARYGYLQEVNGNCERCASPFTPCLMAANTWAMCQYTPVHLGWRDSDGDGTLDPMDPLESPAVDWRRICRRFPAVCELFGMHGLPAASSPADAHETIPLFLLRRVLTADEMGRVEAALAAEDRQYVEALTRKLEGLIREVRGQPAPAARAPRPKRRR